MEASGVEGEGSKNGKCRDVLSTNVNHKSMIQRSAQFCIKIGDLELDVDCYLSHLLGTSSFQIWSVAGGLHHEGAETEASVEACFESKFSFPMSAKQTSSQAS